MPVRLAVICLMLLAGFGCRACSNYCDYSSPVANSRYANQPGRAGSAFHGAAVPMPVATVGQTSEAPIELTIPAAPQVAAEPINSTATPALFLK